MPGRLGSSIVFLSTFWLFLVAFHAQAFATHELDHRFTVYGTVRDGTSFPGKPLNGKEVVVRDAKTNKIRNRGVTDAQGNFSLVLHVHNSDRGNMVVVQASATSQKLDLKFDPDDMTTDRRARVDLVVFPPHDAPTDQKTP